MDDNDDGCESGARGDDDDHQQDGNKDKGKVDGDIDEDGNDDPFLDDGIWIAGGWFTGSNMLRSLCAIGVAYP